MNDDTEIVQLGASNMVESTHRAEVDMQITTARKYPRALAQVKQAMISFATLDQETAESCFYKLPRGGKSIEGPSIRLAEIAVSCYGNLRAGTRILETVTTGDNPHVVVQAMAHDLEKNVAITMEKRRRITKKKSKETIDEDDINLATNACSAIAFRDAVFKVVPGALIKPVFEQAKLVAIGDAKTLVDRRARAFESFGKMGVTPDRVLAVLGKKGMDDVDLNDLGTLFGLHTAIREGQTSIDEAFSTPEQGKKPDLTGASKPAATQAEPTAEKPKVVELGQPTPAAEAKKKQKSHIAEFQAKLDAEKKAAAEVKKPEPEPAAEVKEPATEKPTEPEAEPEDSGEDVSQAEQGSEDPAASVATGVSVHDDFLSVLNANRVPVAEFLGWCHFSGKLLDANKMKFEELPAEFLLKFANGGPLALSFEKCVKLYGKPAPTAA